eukprot:CAMPEP_0202960282 /NCGR_PEP_ID=MMETSP1396-20130829/4435_1 /ASSEMBLY_ACC=CAM_ASM_000872 /TAXON_ID= /ORGANISM="Pseudokeronopsis sp., Strain Brazil" /LENGTH=67 /DNA_ID=CAMNT_0049679403 /DNA_START=7 /DNA_END=210 /DNA_ORIENTATION=+
MKGRASYHTYYNKFPQTSSVLVIAPYTPVLDPKNPELVIHTHKKRSLKDVMGEKGPSLQKVLNSGKD